MVDKEEIELGRETKRDIKIGIAIVAVILVVMCIAIPVMAAYNALVDSDLQVNRAAANIKTDLERRADLLPNLASEIQGSAIFEHATIVDTIAARAGDASEIKNRIQSANTVSDISQQETKLDTVFGGIMTLNEAYPTLQTTEQFKDFEAQTTATENEILVDRQTYNSAVMQYQSACRSFPTNLVAGEFGFYPDKYQMYTPVNQTNAETVPTVTFDFSNL
jgi:LemA protein